MKGKLRRLFRNSEGQTVVEDGLLLSLGVLAVTMVTAAPGHAGALVAMAATSL